MTPVKTCEILPILKRYRLLKLLTGKEHRNGTKYHQFIIRKITHPINTILIRFVLQSYSV